MIDLELEFARRALKYAKDGINEAGEEYRNLCKSFPSLVVTNGLSQAISFYESKNKNEHRQVIGNVRKELDIFLKEKSSSLQTENDLSKELLNLEINDYIKFEERILAMFKWLRRYVDIYSKGKENKDENLSSSGKK